MLICSMSYLPLHSKCNFFLFGKTLGLSLNQFKYNFFIFSRSVVEGEMILVHQQRFGESINSGPCSMSCNFSYVQMLQLNIQICYLQVRHHGKVLTVDGGTCSFQFYLDYYPRVDTEGCFNLYHEQPHCHKLCIIVNSTLLRFHIRFSQTEVWQSFW